MSGPGGTESRHLQRLRGASRGRHSGDDLPVPPTSQEQLVLAYTDLGSREPVHGSYYSPMPESCSMHSMRSCRHFALKSGKSRNTPVTLRPGRARLATKPLATGSLSRSIAITGMLVVAWAAACTAAGAAATMAST